MKKMMIFAVLVIVSMTAFAQVSKEEQELIDLSNQKWVWMAEKKCRPPGGVVLGQCAVRPHGWRLGQATGSGYHSWWHDLVQTR